MARSIEEIKTQAQQVFVSEMETAGKTVTPATWSAVTIVRCVIHAFAFCANVIEKLFDVFKSDVDFMIRERKPHTLRWYVNKAKDFRFGYPLIAESDEYDNTGLTTAQIESAKVVRYAACTKQLRANGRPYLRMKVAGESGGDMVQLTEPVMDAFKDYMFRVSDAVVDMDVESLPADRLKQRWVIYYDPLILDSNGARIDGRSTTPVQDEIKAYLKRLLFNGTYVPTYHVDAIQQVEGVVIPLLEECQSAYGTLPFTSVSVKYIPDGGRLRFATDEDLVVSFVPQTEIR